MLRDEVAVMMDDTYIYINDEEYSFRERVTLRGTSFAELEDFNLTPPLPECSICREIIEDNLHTTACNHTYHRSCIDMWIATQVGKQQDPSCPICRAELT